MEKINSDLFKKFENDKICNLSGITGGERIDTLAGYLANGWCYESDITHSDCGCTSYYGMYRCSGGAAQDTTIFS